MYIKNHLQANLNRILNKKNMKSNTDLDYSTGVQVSLLGLKGASPKGSVVHKQIWGEVRTFCEQLLEQTA